MRNISPAGLAKLANRQGNEPITICEIDWVVGRAASSYADRDVEGISGRIIEVGDLDNVVGVSNNTSSQSLTVTLDDTDRTIKAIFDAHDIHKRDARVYQYFQGLDLADKFLLFAGKISSPVTWNERDRTVKFTIISQLEDREVGFSAEEGQFPYLPADLVGKAWPMIFGTVQDCPALQINHAVTGTTLTGVGIISGESQYTNLPLYDDGSDTDGGANMSASQMSAQSGFLLDGALAWERYDPEKAAALYKQADDISDKMSEMLAKAAAQRYCAMLRKQQQLADAKTQGNGANPIKILGGEDFSQQRTITIDINGGLFTGRFQGDLFYVSSRTHPVDETKATNMTAAKADPCPPKGQHTSWHFEMELPCQERSGGMYIVHGCQLTSDGFASATGGSNSGRVSSEAILQQFWADAGAAVRMHSSEPITYIVSITPGTVLAVKAYKQFTGERRLVVVPDNLYRVETKNYGAVTAVQIVFDKPLSTVADQTTTNNSGGWSDDIYVTFQATAPTYGPNIMDILIHLISTYTDLDYDETTFNAVKTKLEKFPANFPILERKNTLTVLQEIAYQARCALWISNGVFYLKYLPEEPVVLEGGEITVSDLDAEKGIEVELTPTEDLVTKTVVKWRVSWAPGSTDRPKDKSEKTMILRHNVTRYGIQEEEYDWYIYNQPDTIYKCATFWLIRKSHTWKRIRFQTYLQKLNLETFDCVNLDFAGGYVASAAVKALVEKANYNSADNTVDFECLVPVKAGNMSLYPFFWPANLEASATWPPEEDELANDCGGGGIGMGATGDLPVGVTEGIGSGAVWVGGPNVVFQPQSDWGDRQPTDVGYVAQVVVNPGAYGELRSRPAPYLNLEPHLLRSSALIPPEPMSGAITVDIRKTLILDAKHPEYQATLEEVLEFTSAGRLAIDGSWARILMPEAGAGALFDFKLDKDTGKMGAGTAFLQDEDEDED